MTALPLVKAQVLPCRPLSRTQWDSYHHRPTWQINRYGIPLMRAHWVSAVSRLATIVFVYSAADGLGFRGFGSSDLIENMSFECLGGPCGL